MTINQALSLAKKMMNNYTELRYWSVNFNRRKRAFGICDYSKNQIELSAILVPVMTDSAIMDTIIHEIAHALTPGNGHNKVWQMKCIELGGDGKRCGGSDKYTDGVVGQQILQEKLAKYTLVCPVCGKKSHKSRKPTRAVSCGSHNSHVYNPLYKMIVTQNF